MIKILDHYKIQQKIKRLAVQIVENNFQEQSITLLGVNENGYRFAQILKHEVESYHPLITELLQVKLNPENPHQYPISLSHSPADNRPIILIDDVANTGRTLFYAISPLLPLIPPKIEVAVLVDRKHKKYPIQVTYVGLSLATTLKEHIEVDLATSENYAAYLQ